MKQARIYKITNTKTNDFYIGSTIQTLKNRFKAHKTNAKQNKYGKLYDCIRENGIENFTIEMIDEFEFEKHDEIGKKEIEYFTTLKPTLNMKKPNVILHKEYGRIYKLYEKLNPSMFYIGSTTKDLNKRLMDHKSCSNKGNTPLYKYIREKGKNSFSIELVEDDIIVKNLIIREDYWINELKPTLNKNIFLCRSEKQRDKDKYQKNKEKIKKQRKERYYKQKSNL